MESLRVLRIRAGLTQRELAQKAGISQPSVNHAENGGPTRPRTMHKIADALGIAFDQITEFHAQLYPNGTTGTGIAQSSSQT